MEYRGSTASDAVPASEHRGATASDAAPASEHRGATAYDAAPASMHRGAAASDAAPASEHRGAPASDAAPASEHRGAPAFDAVPALEHRGVTASDAVPSSEHRGATAFDAVPASEHRGVTSLLAVPSLSDITDSSATTTTRKTDEKLDTVIDTSSGDALDALDASLIEDTSENASLAMVSTTEQGRLAIQSMASCHQGYFTAVSVFQDPIVYTLYRPFSSIETVETHGDYSMSARWKYFTSLLVVLIRILSLFLNECLPLL